MALDRQSIEKKDFPTGSYGYDPEAVDAHLSALADEVAEFRNNARRRSEHVASSTSDQVRTIIEAAEASAADIQHSAEADAHEIREEAQQESHAIREHAAAEVRGHVSRVSEATSAMLTRLQNMESELAGMLDNLRGGAGRIDDDLRALGGELEGAAALSKPPVRTPFERDTPLAVEPELPPAVEPAPAAPEAGDGWGESTSTAGDGGWGESTAASESGWGESPASESGWGEPPAATPSEPAESDAGWSAGPTSSGWGTPESSAEADAAEGFPSEDLGTEGHEPAGASHDWSASAPAPALGEAAPAETGAESFPASPSAPPGEAAPSGEPSFSGSSADFGSDAAAPHDGGQGEDDTEGARLIALNMALNGTPREETARYLSENFQLSNRDGLLDEVYASVEG